MKKLCYYFSTALWIVSLAFALYFMFTKQLIQMWIADVFIIIGYFGVQHSKKLK